MRVPVVPRSASARRSGLVMRTSSPPASTKPSAASIFGPHAAGGELPVGEVTARLVDADDVECALVGGAEIDRDPVDAGRDAQQVGAHRASEQRRGEVLVDDRLDALEPAVGPLDHGDPAAARGDNEEARVDQRLDRVLLDDPHRPRRGDEPAPAAARVLGHGPPVLLGEAARDGLLVEAADRLRRRGERGVAGVDHGVREGRDDLLVEAGRAQLALQRRAEDVAEAPLGVGDRHVEVELRQPGLDVGDEVRAAHDEADLRAVAVRQDDPPAVGHEPAQLRGEPPGGVELLGDRGGPAAVEEGVAPDGDDGGAGGGRHARTVGRARARVMGWT